MLNFSTENPFPILKSSQSVYSNNLNTLKNQPINSIVLKSTKQRGDPREKGDHWEDIVAGGGGGEDEPKSAWWGGSKVCSTLEKKYSTYK